MPAPRNCTSRSMAADVRGGLAVVERRKKDMHLSRKNQQSWHRRVAISQLSKETRSRIMRSIKSVNTKPELIVRRWLHRHGFRYRLHDRALPGTPDVVLPRYKAAIQIRGCFWHCHNCKRGTFPKTSQDYWIPKLRKTVIRDRLNDTLLRSMGYEVIVIWECETKKQAEFETAMEATVLSFNQAGTSISGLTFVAR
jgi:DNA mismatch endonuclease (patch repair protein)